MPDTSMVFGSNPMLVTISLTADAGNVLRLTKPFSSEETLKAKSSLCTVASWMGAFEDAFIM